MTTHTSPVRISVARRDGKPGLVIRSETGEEFIGFTSDAEAREIARRLFAEAQEAAR